MPCLDDSRKIKFLFLLSKNSLINHILVIEKKAKINSPQKKTNTNLNFVTYILSQLHICVCVY